MSFEDFFADADYGDIEAQKMEAKDWNLPEGRHLVKISDAGPKATKSKKTGAEVTKFRVVFTGGDTGDQSYTEWIDPIQPSDHQEMKDVTRGGQTVTLSVAQLKAQRRVNFFVALGVPQDQIKHLKPEQLQGIQGWLTISKNGGGYMTFRQWEPATPFTGGNGKASTDGLAEFAKAPANLGEFGI